MKFKTVIPINKQVFNQIDYRAKVFLLGSCFSENIGKKLAYFKFQTSQNPFGILFHPKAIEKFIINAVNEKEYVEKELVFHNERFHCFDAHSLLSSSKKEVLLERLNTGIKETNKQLKSSSHILVTLGTSWVYRLLETDEIVANCHKIPQNKFSKEILSIDEIGESLELITAAIKKINTKAIVIFTVSPVRHLKDGFVENQRSKSHLITAIHQLLDTDSKSHFYFPSYEIMMDELRDYRFFAEDMIHLNNTAINYMWERFVSTWVSEESATTMKEIETIQKGISHKPFDVNSQKHQLFLYLLSAKIEKIQQQFSFIKFHKEKN
jgi:hypothetical protein